MIHFDLAGLKARIKELEEQMNAPDFWNDLERSQQVNREIKILKSKINSWQKAWGIGGYPGTY